MWYIALFIGDFDDDKDDDDNDYDGYYYNDNGVRNDNEWRLW